ncbi:MAG: hypothetical protein CMA66_07610 [Euryarchaeota archaeon]|nr:hypothetical protein [Euryarchaeota archaeon]
MADNLRTFAAACQGGLVLNLDPLSQGSEGSGSAIRMINYEPALQGGYRRISGFSNSYGELTGLANSPVLGVHVAADINQGIFGCRRPTTGNNYFHWYNHYYTVAVTSGTGSNFTVGETITAVVSGSDNTVVPISATVISKTANAIVLNFGKLPSAVFSVGNVITGGTSTTVSTITSAPVVLGWQEVTTSGSPNTTTVTKIRFENFNWGAPKFVLVDGVNPAATWDGTTYTQLTTGNVPTKPSLAAAFNNHLFLAGDSTEPFNLYFSAPVAETDWTPASGAGVINVGFKIIQIKAFRDQLFVFGSNNIKRLVGTNIANFELQTVTSNLGCVAPDTVIEFNGDVLFLAPDGVRPITGTDRIGDIELATLSKPIQSIFETYTAQEDLATLTAVVVKKKSQFRMFFADQESLGILGAVRRSGAGGAGFEYSQLVGVDVKTASSGYLGDEEFVIHGDSEGLVYRQESGTDFNGSNIFSLMQTPFYYMDDPGLRKTFYDVDTYMRSEGEVTVVMAVEYDYSNPDTKVSSDYTLSTKGAASFYDTAKFDATDIYDGNPSPVESSSIVGSAKSISIRYVTNSKSPSHTIQAVTITYGLGDRR